MKYKVLAMALGLSLAGTYGGAARPEAHDGDSDGQVRRIVRVGAGGHLGVSLADVEHDDLARLKLSDERGALVKDVADDSPALRAGVKVGDVIVSFQGEPVRSAAQLSRLVRETPAGRKVGLEVSRDGSVQKLSCELGRQREMNLSELPPELPGLPDASQWRDFGRSLGRDLGRGMRFGPQAGRGRLGITYQEISGQMAHYFKLEADQGVLITNVEPDSPAAKAGLEAGDVVLSFAGHDIEDGGDLREALADAKPGSEARIKVLRDGRHTELTVTLRAPETERDRGRSF